MIVVVVMVVMMYIGEEWNLCWFHSLTHTLKMTVSQYMIASPLLVLSTQLLTTLSTDYCPNEMVNNFVLRRIFYSKQCYKNNRCSST